MEILQKGCDIYDDASDCVGCGMADSGGIAYNTETFFSIFFRMARQGSGETDRT